MPLNVVFMGTPEFSVPTLNALIKNKHNVIKVYTQPPTKSKRGQKVNPSPVEEFCKKNLGLLISMHLYFLSGGGRLQSKEQ